MAVVEELIGRLSLQTKGIDQAPTIVSLQEGPFLYEEPRHVFDLTVGGHFLFKYNTRLAAGISVPLTGASTYRTNYLIALSVSF